MRIDVQNLKFNRVEDAPISTCNYCGRETTDIFTCDIELFSDLEKKALIATAHYTLIVCSRACEKFLKSHPETPRMISYQIGRMREIHLDQEKTPGYREQIQMERMKAEEIIKDALGQIGLTLGPQIGRDE